MFARWSARLFLALSVLVRKGRGPLSGSASLIWREQECNSQTTCLEIQDKLSVSRLRYQQTYQQKTRPGHRGKAKKRPNGSTAYLWNLTEVRPIYRSFLNSPIVSPASCTIPPIVYALTGLWRGMVTMRTPSDMTMCFPSRTTRKPAFLSAFTAARWFMPANFGTTIPVPRPLGLLLHSRSLHGRRGTLESRF